MYYYLNQADGDTLEGARWELGERFLARPGDILNTMTWFWGIEPNAARWPGQNLDGGDLLAQALAEEFREARSPAAQERFLALLAPYDGEAYGGMARDVRTAYESR